MEQIQTILAQARLHRSVEGESRRLFYGRGHCFAGLEDVVIDHHPGLIVIFLYRERQHDWLEALARQLSIEDPSVHCVAVQHRYDNGCPMEALIGVLPSTPLAVEAGLRYQLNLQRGQNIEFFPDMAFGRALVRQHAAGKKILNLFAYTCSFSVAALAAGARQVVNVDMSRSALDQGRLNHTLNDSDLRAASFVAVELFRSFGRMAKLGPFDLIVCDPPAQQGKSFTAKTHWPKLLKRLPHWLSPGGELMLCVNGPHLPEQFMEEQIALHLPEAQQLQCHVAGSAFPEKDPRCVTRLYHLKFPS
jgi:23S rRNA (cytosine1962-C5)-methyltransferase